MGAVYDTARSQTHSEGPMCIYLHRGVLVKSYTSACPKLFFHKDTLDGIPIWDYQDYLFRVHDSVLEH